MTHTAALPFRLKRGEEAMSATTISSTTETVHGLLLLDDDALVIQWRVARATDHVGMELRSEKEVEPVRELRVPIRSVAGAVVRRRWWDRITGPRLVLTSADLRAFEGLAGEEGLSLDHPAELVLPLRRKDRLAAEEFSAELALAVAEAAAEGRARLDGSAGRADGSGSVAVGGPERALPPENPSRAAPPTAERVRGGAAPVERESEGGEHEAR